MFISGPQGGTFVSTGAAKIIQLRADVDYMHVRNLTVAATSQTTAVGVEYYWQRGMPAGAMWEYKKSNAANAANLSVYATTGGFTLIDTSANPVGALNATITAISNAAIPVESDSGTTGLLAGDVVRIIDVAGAQQLGGLDFTVGHNTLTANTFSLDYMAQLTVAGTSGSWRKISTDPLFYPRRRYITKITQAASAVVTLSVTHGYQVGQKIRFVVPAAYGMVEMNGLLGTITAINTTLASGNTVTVNIDSSAFTAFAFPLTAVAPFSPAETIPVGEDTAAALSAGVDILTDATVNAGYIGISLAAGANSPAGVVSDVIIWTAGTFNV